MLVFASYVGQPTIAPTNSGSSGTYQVKHRRVNLQGTHSLPSPTLTGVGFPCTLTPQSYSDTDSLWKDEFLVSNDSGVTWYVVPRTVGSITGAQTIAAFSGSWATTALTDNQAGNVTNIDFGNFQVSASPSKYLYVLNNTDQVLGTLTADVVDSATGTTSTTLGNHVQFSYMGYVGISGTGGLGGSASNLIWGADRFNLLAVDTPVGNLAKLKVTLVNMSQYVASSSTISFGIGLTANKTTYDLYGFTEWPIETIWLNPSQGFVYPYVTLSGGTLTVKRLATNASGIAAVVPIDTVLSSTGLSDGDYIVAITPDSYLALYTLSTLPSNAVKIAQITVTSGVWSNLILLAGLRNPASGVGVSANIINFGRFIQVNSSGLIDQATSTSNVLGGSTRTVGSGQQAYYTTSGLVLLQAGTTITAGNKLAPDSNGKAVLATGVGYAIALESATSDKYFLAALRSVGVVGDKGDKGDTGSPGSVSSASGIVLTEITTPFTPSSGTQEIFIDSSDHVLKLINSSGTVSTVGTGGGGGGSSPWVSKSSNYTASAYDKLLLDATTGFTLTLPASPSGGQYVSVLGSKGSAIVNLNPNSQPYKGGSPILWKLKQNYVASDLVYVDGTVGWVPTNPEAFISSNAYNSEVLTDSPWLYWRLGEGSGTTAADASGNSRTGTYAGTYTQGQSSSLSYDTDTAVSFNGGSVSGSATLVNPTTFTLEVRFKTTTTSQGTLIGFSNGSNRDRELYIDTSGRLNFATFSGSFITLTTSASYNDGAWHTVSLVLTGGVSQIWVDGVMAASMSGQNAQSYTGYWVIGGGYFGNFVGTLDEASVTLTAISSNRLQVRHAAAF